MTNPPVNTTPGPAGLPPELPGSFDPEAIEIPEPAIFAEAGVTTSEWKLVIRYLMQLAGVGAVALANQIAQASEHVGLTLSPAMLDALVKLELAAGVAVVGYALSRGIRKLFTK